MAITREQLNAWAQELKLDFIGVASPDRYRDVAPQFNPLSILPEARAIVVFGREIPRSYFRGIEEGTLWMRVDRYLPPKPGYFLCRRFEDNGHLALPCSLLAPERWPDGVAAAPDKPAPNVAPDVRVAAQLAGIGEIGFNGTFLTPRFGVRQALGMCITDAPLAADAPFPSGQICDRDHCRACVDGCPNGALSAASVEQQVGDLTIRVGRYTLESCRFCRNGAYPDTSCDKAPPNRLAAACTRACLACIEDGGRIKTAFRHPFRRREAWSLRNFT
jgi:ferredoxin